MAHGLGPGRRPPIDHVVVIIKENRTMEQIFGGGPQDPGPGPLAGFCIPSRARALQPTVPWYCDCPFPPRALPLYQALARRFTLGARHFSEVRGPSDANHYMLMAAQSPVAGNMSAWEPAPDMETLADRFAEAGLTWRNYAGYRGAGFQMVAHLQRAPQQRRWQDFEADARRGDLPALAWLTPPFPQSDHPPGRIQWGQNWTARQVLALAAGPCWPRTAAFVLWDDWGGFWDRVPPPVVERWKDGKPFRYGRRVGLLVISPYARHGLIYRTLSSHVSLAAYCEAVFGLPPLTWRDALANPLLDCFDWDAPDTSLPAMRVPDPGAAERALTPVLNLCAVLFHLFER